FILDKLPDGGSMILVSVETACDLLRRHGAKGGAFLAELLEEITEQDFHLIAVTEDFVETCRVIGGVSLITTRRAYEEMDSTERPEFLLPDECLFPDAVDLRLPDGRLLHFRGPTPQIANLAARLVGAVYRSEGQTGKDNLATLLREQY